MVVFLFGVLSMVHGVYGWSVCKSNKCSFLSPCCTCKLQANITWKNNSCKLQLNDMSDTKTAFISLSLSPSSILDFISFLFFLSVSTFNTPQSSFHCDIDWLRDTGTDREKTFNSPYRSTTNNLHWQRSKQVTSLQRRILVLCAKIHPRQKIGSTRQEKDSTSTTNTGSSNKRSTRGH